MIETDVLLGLGANVGDAARNLAAALDRLRGVLEVRRVSSVYRSAPVGHRDQPHFLNLVCAASSGLRPEPLLLALQAVERAVGRVPTFRHGPRVIDIDLLAYGETVLDTPQLTLPHASLHERGFVLVPLAEVAPQWRHPVLGRTAAQLLASAPHADDVTRIGPLERLLATPRDRG